MFISNPFRGAFGLDIGDLSIKLVQLHRRASPFRQAYFSIDETRSISMPPGYIVNGEIQQPEAVRKKLFHLLGRGGKQKPIKAPWVVADLPEPKTFLKLIEIDIPPAEIIPDDISYHAKKHIPFEIDSAYLDWQIVNQAEDGKSASVLIGAANKIIADSYIYLLESVGLTPLALEIEAVAIARAMITADKDYNGEARAIIDLGAARSGFIIYDRGSVQFSTNLNFSGELVTMALSQELNLEYADAEKLKITNGLTHDKQRPKYLKIVSDLVNNLTEEIKKSIRFYKDHFKEANPITHLTLCGGAARLINLDTTLARQLKISARPGKVWKNLFNPRINHDGESQPLASAIGLALRAAENPLEDKL